MYNTLDANLLKIAGAIPELAPLAAKHGLAGVNVPASILEDPKMAQDARTAAMDHGLTWGLLPTPVDFFSDKVDGRAFDEALVKLERWAAVGEKLGVRYSYNHVWPSNAARPFAENFEWHVERLRRLQPIFEDHGIRYGLEFLGVHELRVRHPHPFVHTISGVLAIADAAGGGTGFLFDTYHWYCGSRRLDDVYYAARNCRRMVNMHVNDAVAGRAPDEQRDSERAMPMETGVIDSAMIYRLFRDSGYEGPVMCEPMTPWTQRFAAMPAEAAVAEVAAAFERLDHGRGRPQPAGA